MAALHKQYIRQRAADKEDPEDEFYTKNCFVCGEVAKPDQVIFFFFWPTQIRETPWTAQKTPCNAMSYF